MSYQPPSQPGDQPGGEPTQPVGGGYTPPPPSGGDYTPPPSGGYTPPPPAGGGYTPPPPSGGYTPPPPPGGGYPPPPTAGGSGGGGGQMDINALFQGYINAVTKPNVSTYEAEIPKANWVSTLIGVAAVAIISAIVALIGFGASTAAMTSMFNSLGGAQGQTLPSFGAGTGGGVTAAVSAFIGTFIGFFLGTGIQFGVAKMQGGQGGDFMVQSYLSSLSYTPLKIVAALLGIIPVVGGFLGLLVSVYQVYNVGLSLQASQRLPTGKAMLAAFVPAIIYALVLCICFVLVVMLGVAILGAATSR